MSEDLDRFTIRELLEEVAQLRADKARLDWLELTAEGVHWQLHGDRDIVTRKAIDAEMGTVTFTPGDCLKSGTYNGPTAAFLYDPKANTAKEIPPP